MLRLVKLQQNFNNRYSTKSSKKVLRTYNPENPLSFKKWCFTICKGETPAYMFLENPLLTEYSLLMDKYKMGYETIENMDYGEFLELVNYTANVNEFINKQQSKNIK